jgi:phosphocarrier protein
MLMINTQVTIINKLGLHARAAAKFVGVTNSWESEILVGKENNLTDGKSIMSVMMLAASQGTVLDLQIDGDDEQEALQSILDIIQRRFDEDE